MKHFILIFTLSILTNIGVYAQETYKVGNTEYYLGQYYSTTGKPLVKRSEANKREFLKSKGYNEIPYGYEIDHIKPLSEGGTDDPSNMQLLTIEQHKRKTANERANRSNSTYSSTSRSYYSNSTYNSNSIYNSSSKSNSTYSTPSYSTPTYSTPSSSSSRSIQTGPRGGKYYINSNGNKTYVK